MGFLTLLSGEYGLSKRKIANLLGHLDLKISLGTICKLHHIGKGLKEAFSELFRLWNGFKSGELTRRELIEGTEAFCKKRIWALLRLGAMGKGLRSKTRGTCKNLLKSFDGLWVYLYEEGVEPTNNLAEQDVRQGVIWRKISNGTQSEAGERFVERILTVGMTLKKQSKSIFVFLVESFQSYIRAGPMPMPI